MESEKYLEFSKQDLTDDNFDDEYQKLIDMLELHRNCDYEIYENLPNGFSEIDPDKDYNFTRYVSMTTKNDHRPGINQCLVDGYIAVKFNNSYLALEFKEAI